MGSRIEEIMTTILIVEDNELNRDMLSRRLIKKGYQIEFAEDGKEGLEKIGDLKPDLVLMDIGLPVMDGWEATRKAKDDPRTRDVPIIALTAHAMAQDKEKALAAGCDEYDTKPIDLNRLLSKISSLT